MTPQDPALQQAQQVAAAWSKTATAQATQIVQLQTEIHFLQAQAQQLAQERDEARAELAAMKAEKALNESAKTPIAAVEGTD